MKTKIRREWSQKKSRPFKKGLDISIVPNFNVSLSINNENVELWNLLNKTLGMSKRESARSPEKQTSINKYLGDHNIVIVIFIKLLFI